MLAQIVFPRSLELGMSRLATAAQRFRGLSWLGFWGLHEALLVAALGTLVFYWRLLGLEPIEIGGDALRVWDFARQLAHGAELPTDFNHHIARFGMVVPVLLAQLVFGSDAWVYYVAPLAASVVLHLSVYGVARSVSGRFGGILAVILLLGFREMIRPSSQILPELFGQAYTCAAFFTALVYTRASSRRGRLIWLALTALLLFGAYGSKISYLYFAPGVALLVWRGRAEPAPREAAPQATSSHREGGHALRRLWRWLGARGLYDPLLLTGMVVGCIALESLFYVVFTSHTSQLAVINETHGLSRKAQVKELAGFFAMYRNAGAEWHMWLGLGFLSMLGLTAVRRDRRASLLVAGVLVYFFLNTFVLRKLNPPIPWTNPHPRYLLAVAAPLMIVVGAFVHEAGASLVARSRLLSGSSKLRSGLSFLLCTALLAVTAQDVRAQYDKRWNKRHPIQLADRLQSELSAAFAAGIPIVTKVRSAKPLRAAGSVYIEPRLLELEGKLADSRQFQGRVSRDIRYLAKEMGGASKKERRALDAEVQRRVKRRRCVIELGQRYRFLTGRTRMPKNCQPLTAPGK